MDYGDNIGRLVGVLHSLFQKELNVRLGEADLDITADQFRMLTRLWKEEGLSQQELATLIDRNRASTGKMIDILQEKDLVLRQPHPSDRRLNLIFLTKKGKKIDSTAQECAKKVLGSFQNDIDPRDLEVTINVLKSMVKNKV